MSLINPNQILTQLGAISVENFLRDYWQQKPLLIRQAFPHFQSPLSANELADLACDTDTARLVLERGGKAAWEVRHGPLRKRDFSKLPATHWTLLVNDIEKLLPEFAEIIEPFRFIPDWRIDDLMISYAVDGGSVGPHVDAYDVFLLQAQGQRRWQISSQVCAEDNFIPDIDLRIMQSFAAEQEWILEPGDMLYLPPDVPHYGVAVGECMTYSIGFRAPSRADLLEDLLGYYLEQPGMQERFRDPKRALQAEPSELAEADLERLTDFVLEALPDRAAIRAWLKETLA
jgi:50S ribosomal protein L16 3-hydroxylase